MRRLTSCGPVVLVLALFLASPSAAADYGNKDLIGTWEGDVMAMMKASGMLEQMPPGFDVAQLVGGFAVVLTFHKDGTVTTYNKDMEGEKADTVHYEVMTKKDNVLTLKNSDEDGEEQMVQVTFSDKDHMEVSVGKEGLPPMQFARSTKKKAKASAAE